MAGIDRRKVKMAFHRQAAMYDSVVDVQKRVVDAFIGRLQRQIGAPPKAILDIGCGTGLLALPLLKIYPDAQLYCLDLAPGMLEAARGKLGNSNNVYYLNADAESLPLADTSVDLIVSTSTLQWLSSLDIAFAEAFRVLVPGGLFSFALYGEKTLWELRDCYRRSALAGCHEDRTHHFFSFEDVVSALARTGFVDCSAGTVQETEWHRDVPHLLRSLKKTGAGNAAPVAGGLAGRRTMFAMMDTYQREHGTELGIPATYDIIYGEGRKVAKDR